MNNRVSFESHLFIMKKYRIVTVTIAGETQMERKPKVRIIPATNKEILGEKKPKPFLTETFM
jgi:hypothetical protein